mmetsp:Transcript_16512/g.62793  ORF Transcript_16512/g.62793 Transcript_16512/m.62793 type:complete len:211 (+) Transcript_16512:845-1477(+)
MISHLPSCSPAAFPAKAYGTTQRKPTGQVPPRHICLGESHLRRARRSMYEHKRPLSLSSQPRERRSKHTVTSTNAPNHRHTQTHSTRRSTRHSASSKQLQKVFHVLHQKVVVLKRFVLVFAPRGLVDPDEVESHPIPIHHGHVLVALQRLARVAHESLAKGLVVSTGERLDGVPVSVANHLADLRDAALLELLPDLPHQLVSVERALLGQ